MYVRMYADSMYIPRGDEVVKRKIGKDGDGGKETKETKEREKGRQVKGRRKGTENEG